MTAVERAFVRRLQRRANRLAPELARRELAAYDMIRKVLTERELVQAIQSGQIDRLIIEILDENVLDEPFVRLRNRIDLVVVDTTAAEAKHLPSLFRSSVFHTLNPLVIDAARAMNTRVIQGLKNEIRETVMQAAERGLAEGRGPRTVARQIRQAIGLAPNQERAVANFRRMLESGDPTVFSRKLRDRRFDRTLQRAFAGEGLSREQIERMTETYRRRFIAHNAETHARTIALDAQKAGQRLAWEDAIRRGIVRRDQLVRTWITVGDDRVRPEHAALNGTQVGFDEPFPNGELTPGDSTYNCRCQARVTLATASVREAA